MNAAMEAGVHFACGIFDSVIIERIHRAIVAKAPDAPMQIHRSKAKPCIKVVHDGTGFTTAVTKVSQMYPMGVVKSTTRSRAAVGVVTMAKSTFPLLTMSSIKVFGGFLGTTMANLNVKLCLELRA